MPPKQPSPKKQPSPLKRPREENDTWTMLYSSIESRRTSNPIRKIVDRLKPSKDCSKALISLSVGDPTLDGNFLPPDSAVQAVAFNLRTAKYNGYSPSIGYPASRASVARYWVNNFCPTNQRAKDLITSDNVILTSGASHAIQMAINTLADEGDNILLPQPAFSLYASICDSFGIQVRRYTCNPHAAWEVDLASLRSMANSQTRAILINNPSNPCGSSFSRQHIIEILKVAESLKLPVISDEIYAGMVFNGATFTSVADIEESNVPRFVIGGTAKAFIVPGWRMGWLFTVDPKAVCVDVLSGIVALSTLIMGPNTVIQASLEDVLNQKSTKYRDKLNKDLETNAKIAYNLFKQVNGIFVSPPQGAMYLMAGIETSKFEDIPDGITFAELLLKEENVVVLPGEIFSCPNFFRIVFTRTEALLKEASVRIQLFCNRHRKKRLSTRNSRNST